MIVQFNRDASINISDGVFLFDRLRVLDEWKQIFDESIVKGGSRVVVPIPLAGSINLAEVFSDESIEDDP